MLIHIALFIRVVTRKLNELYFKVLIIYPKQTMVFALTHTHTYTKPKTKTMCLNAWLAELRSGLDVIKAFGTWDF